MKIRQEQETDKAAIELLTYRAFKNHPHHEPGAEPTEHTIINKLRDENKLSLSLVCEEEGCIVGHIAFSPVTINGKSVNWLGLAPVSVIPEKQGKGIGTALINEALSQLQTAKYDGIVLLGEPEYYGRFGFIADSHLTLPGVPAEYFLVKSFINAIPQGEVGYQPVFFE